MSDDSFWSKIRRSFTVQTEAERRIEQARKEDLAELDLSKLGLTELPDSISRLSNLKTLSLHNNQLTELPDSIGDLSNLRSLHLSVNQLTKLPDSIGQLSNLRELYLVENQLTELPDSIGQLSNLRELNLRSNQLTKLSDFIGKLSNLHTLDLLDNQLTELPESISELSSLRILFLSHNPLVSPPWEIANRGFDAIKDYFGQLREQGEERLYEAKLLIVGAGGAGKTTLANKLVNSNYIVGQEDSTDGIEISPWEFQHHCPEENKEVTFQANIWDFGGQAIYHSTHQFFLSKRSVYVLLADDRKEETDFYYWLSIIELLGKECPVFIIKNYREKEKSSIPVEELKKRFPQVQGSIALDLKQPEARQWHRLVQRLKNALTELPHVGDTLPAKWKIVRQDLRERAENKAHYLSLDDYKQICQSHDFDQEKQQLQLSRYLHDLGTCLHFQDDAVLRNTFVLNPEWATDAVYNLLDTPAVRKRGGRFRQQEMAEAWRDSIYDGKHPELLQLLLNFKLSYRLRGRDEYIIPALLSEDKPVYLWDSTDNLQLRYEYLFRPKGILHHLIVQLHNRIAEQDQRKIGLVWNKGVILAWGGDSLQTAQTVAEIRELNQPKRLEIRVRGIEASEKRAIIANAIDEIHESFHNLKVTRQIHCQCEDCKNATEPFFHKHEHLLNGLHKQSSEVQCQHSFRMVNIGLLLKGIPSKEENSPHRLHSTGAEAVHSAPLHKVDLLVVAALPRELTSFRKLLETLEGCVWEEKLTTDNLLYHQTTVSKDGEDLVIAGTAAPKMGPEVMIHHINQFAFINPRMALMTGICAGRRSKVKLGEPIIAKRAFSYDQGKLKNGQLQPEMETQNLKDASLTWLQAYLTNNEWQAWITEKKPVSLRYQREWALFEFYKHQGKKDQWPDEEAKRTIKTNCPDWKQVLTALREEGFFAEEGLTLTESGSKQVKEWNNTELKKEAEPDKPLQAHIGVFASGNNVVEDRGVFPALLERERDVLALEMEAAAFLFTARKIYRDAPCFVVKSVCDYADEEKNDNFQPYAQQTSAAWAWGFAKYVLLKLKKQWSL
jgi:nucleoside phosphorylase/GTPase SAR1 family protein